MAHKKKSPASLGVCMIGLDLVKEYLAYLSVDRKQVAHTFLTDARTLLQNQANYILALEEENAALKAGSSSSGTLPHGECEGAEAGQG